MSTPPMFSCISGNSVAEHDAAGENAHRDLGDDERDQADDGEDVARFFIESALQKFRHGEHHRAHVERHEDPGQHQQAPGVQFVVSHGDAAGGAGAGESDDVLRTDVRGEDRSADDPPAQIASGQEVIGWRLSLLLRTTHQATQSRMPKYSAIMSQSRSVMCETFGVA